MMKKISWLNYIRPSFGRGLWVGGLLAFALSLSAKPGKELHDLMLSYMEVEDLHPDSLERNIYKLKGRRLQSADPSERAVYAAAIARYYAARMAWRSVGTDLRDSAVCWYGIALADKQVLAKTKAKRWKKFVIVGKDEDYFGGDMLNVVWRSMVNEIGKSVRDTSQCLPKYEEMIDFYKQRNMRNAALLLSLDTVGNLRTADWEAAMLKIRDEYADLPLCAEVYLRLGTSHRDQTVFRRREWLQEGIRKYPKYRRKSVLQNALTILSDPNFSWSGPTTVYPGKQYMWRFSARNVQSVVIDGKEHPFPQHDPIEAFSDTLFWTAPAPGDLTLVMQPKTTARLPRKVEPLRQDIRVSRLQALYQQIPDGRVRMLVVDAETGRPQPGVTVTAYVPEQDSVYFEGVTDPNGKVSVPKSRYKARDGRIYTNSRLRVRMSRADEMHLPIQSVYTYGNSWHGAPTDSTHITRLYTDRNIYRPGQTVHVGGLVFDQLDWEASVREGKFFLLELRDPNRKTVETKEVTTDEMGVFSADFVLPEGGKRGNYEVSIVGGTSTWIRMEEYKRPTFEVQLDDSVRFLPAVKPSVIDSFLVSGTARTYDGSPLRNARVTGHYRWSFFWLYNIGKRLPSEETIRLDTLETDDEGRFYYRLPIPTADRHRPSLSIHVDVLSQHGESQNASRWYWRHIEPPKPVTPPTAPKYTHRDSIFLVRCEVDSFSVNRSGRVSVTTNLRDVCLHYTLAAAGKIWTDTMLVLTDETRVFEIPYRPEYDQSATLSFCFVKGEEVYTASKTLFLAMPEKKLRMRWDTFRDLLQPGQQEEWRLTLLNPDGTPAKANVMMAMYDASLDYFGAHEWGFAIHRDHRRYDVAYNRLTMDHIANTTYTSYSQKLKKEKDILLSEIDDNLFRVTAYYRMYDNGGPRLLGRAAASAGSPLLLAKAVEVEETRAEVTMDRAVKKEAAETEEDASTEAEEEAMPAVPLRENFNETAFFYPQLRTGADGQATISFTLPESLTRWNLLGMAHTKELNYLNLREEIEARKDLMAQLYLPRFLRPGDEASLSASVRNVSDEVQTGRGTLQVLDAKTERVLKTWKTDIRLESQRDTAFSFGYVSPDEDVIVRWAVEGTTCSDGEQRLLPVMPATMHLTNTLAITAYNPSVQNLDLTKLFPKGVTDRRLTVEYTTHPELYALQALPPLARTQRCDVLSLSAAYYAGILAKSLDVKMADSTEVYLERIRNLQTPEGGFRWFPDMPASPYLTREVSYLLTRLRMLTGERVAQKVNEDAVHYLLAQRIDSAYLSTADLRNLYIAQYSGVSLTKAERKKVDFLMKLAKREDAEEDGYERQALLAIVLKEGGADRKARKCAQLFRKYIVSSPERGSYIEFPKGSFTSIDRKLHIHVQLMEALQRMNPEDSLLSGMRRYLLQQKRTQEWSTPINTANAVFALMFGQENRDASKAKDLLTLTRQHSTVQNFTAEDDTLGYLRDSMEITERTLPVRLRIHKFSKGESWGGVFADFEQRFSDVKAHTEGLSVRAEYPEKMKRGNRYTVRYYLTADRDYEYVTLVLPRPAATEPVYQRSGYYWNIGTSLGLSGTLACYRQVHDATTELSFYQIPRGEYLIEENLYVERDGTYHSGVSVIRCEYAEEFQGHSDDTVIQIEK